MVILVRKGYAKEVVMVDGDTGKELLSEVGG
jgi:hypothetical protein